MAIIESLLIVGAGAIAAKVGRDRAAPSPGLLALINRAGGKVAAVTTASGSGPTFAKDDSLKAAAREAFLTECQAQGASAGVCEATWKAANGDLSAARSMLEKAAREGASSACNELPGGQYYDGYCADIAEWAFDKVWGSLKCAFSDKSDWPWQKPGMLRAINSRTDLKPGEIYLPPDEVAFRINRGSDPFYIDGKNRSKVSSSPYTGALALKSRQIQTPSAGGKFVDIPPSKVFWPFGHKGVFAKEAHVFPGVVMRDLSGRFTTGQPTTMPKYIDVKNRNAYFDRVRRGLPKWIKCS